MFFPSILVFFLSKNYQWTPVFAQSYHIILRYEFHGRKNKKMHLFLKLKEVNLSNLDIIKFFLFLGFNPI
jgi:hypothetical protein